MIRKHLLALFLLLAAAVPGQAATCASIPFTFVNGQTADANQVNTDLQSLRTCITVNAASSGANNDITQLSALSTPLSLGQGGTGRTDGQNLLPTGVIMPYVVAAPPSGWLLCDGSAVSRSSFAALFALIGTTYGAGDGSTTFNLPDLRGRTVAGYDAGNASGRLTASTAQGVSAGTIGNAGGEQAHTQVTSEMASHTHGVTDPGHSHTASTPTNNSGVMGSGNNPPPASASGTINNQFGQVTTSNLTGITINAQGGGQAANVVQPTIVLAYIIKT